MITLNIYRGRTLAERLISMESVRSDRIVPMILFLMPEQQIHPLPLVGFFESVNTKAAAINPTGIDSPIPADSECFSARSNLDSLFKETIKQ
jgi:hypothetical protein